MNLNKLIEIIHEPTYFLFIWGIPIILLIAGYILILYLKKKEKKYVMYIIFAWNISGWLLISIYATYFTRSLFIGISYATLLLILSLALERNKKNKKTKEVQ